MPVDPTQTPQAVLDPQGFAIQMPSAEDAASSPGGAAQQQKSAPPQAVPVAAAQAPVAAPAAVPPVTAPGVSKNPAMHSFISRVLGAFAGSPPVQYEADASGKITPSANQRPDTNVNKVGRIVQHALVGLSAPDPGGRPSVLKGIGAGFGAMQKQMTEQDAASKEDARKDFETAQQTKLRQFEIARANAQNFQLHTANLHQQNDLDPVRAQNKEIADAFRTMPDHGVREMSAEAVKAAVLDPNNQTWAHTHLILPAGFEDVTDSNGKPLQDAEGNYRTEGRVFVIDGMKDGKVPIPASIASDVQKYRNYGDLAKLSGLDGIKAGDEYDAPKFVKLYNALLTSKVEVEKGWSNPEVSEDKDGKIVQRNAVNNETKPAILAQVQKFQMDKANLAEKQQQVKTGKSTEIKNIAEAEKARKDALAKDASGRHVDSFGNTSPLADKEFDKRYDAFNKSKQYQNLQVLQGSFQQFQQAVNDINAGKDLTGAASVVGLFNAIGISATPLQGKGFRINENTIKEHVDARGLDQAAYQKLLSLKSGAVITPQQLKDYANIAAGVYRDSYINTANEQRRELGYIDVLPLGNNEPIDPMTAQLYLKIAGNDPAKARAAAQKSGWIVPQSK